jgi:hypothetical protein
VVVSRVLRVSSLLGGVLKPDCNYLHVEIHWSKEILLV